jgi:hypothetical protein
LLHRSRTVPRYNHLSPASKAADIAGQPQPRHRRRELPADQFRDHGRALVRFRRFRRMIPAIPCSRINLVTRRRPTSKPCRTHRSPKPGVNAICCSPTVYSQRRQQRRPLPTSKHAKGVVESASAPRTPHAAHAASTRSRETASTNTPTET